jgi:hypothetical protein
LIPIASNQQIAIDCTGKSFLTLGLPSFQTRCPLDVKKYPFDTQKCSIIIGSWMYMTKDLHFESAEIINAAFGASLNRLDYSNYIDHKYWNLDSFTKTTVADSSRFLFINKLFNTSAESRDLSFDLVLKRRPLYVMINSIYINFVLNLVILLAFHMPFASQITLCKNDLKLWKF